MAKVTKQFTVRTNLKAGASVDSLSPDYIACYDMASSIEGGEDHAELLTSYCDAWGEDWPFEVGAPDWNKLLLPLIPTDTTA